ncbi:hypothetical protein B0H10DRAFT_2226848 [Mycena sp. CBHHK59/15]|nr:hypothetical protein B0H10DRAFT_2226848 [Mycena sp. CBHHK59/15]
MVDQMVGILYLASAHPMPGPHGFVLPVLAPMGQYRPYLPAAPMVSHASAPFGGPGKDAVPKPSRTVDTSIGAVTTEIITFHFVPDMKVFNKYVKEHSCITSHRKIMHEEQDKINKTQKLQAYLAKNPSRAKVAMAGSSKTLAAASAAPSPLGTSQTLKRTANAVHLDDADASRV